MNQKLTGGKRKRNVHEENLDVMIDEDEEYVPMAPGNFERQFEFEVNEVNFELDRGGIEHFTLGQLPRDSQTFELIPVIMGDEKKGIPNPLTSVIKVNHESARPDPNEGQDEGPPNMMIGSGPDVDTQSWEWKKDVYGFITVVDVPRLRQCRFAAMFRNYILNMCPNEDLRRKSETLLNDLCGWIMNCHVANLPFQLSAMIHRNLLNEVKKEIEGKRVTFFKYFVIVAKCYKIVKDQKFEHQSKKVKGTIVFSNPEEEFYYRRAILSYMSPIHNENTYDSNTPMLDQNVKFYNLVIFFTRDRYNKIISSMEAAVGSKQQ